MKYDIRCIFKGEAKKIQNKLVTEVYKKFGEKKFYRKKEPPHITLKYGFETKKIKELQKKIDKILENVKDASAIFKGYKSFEYPKDYHYVIYSNYNLDKEGYYIQKEIIKILKKESIEIQSRDKKWKPHSTICFTNSKNKCNKILNYLNKQESPKYKIDFKNIILNKKS